MSGHEAPLVIRIVGAGPNLAKYLSWTQVWSMDVKVADLSESLFKFVSNEICRQMLSQSSTICDVFEYCIRQQQLQGLQG